MRPKRRDDADVRHTDRRCVDACDKQSIDTGRRHRNRRRTTAGAQTSAGVLAVLIRRRAVVMRHGVPGVIGHVNGGCVAAMLRAMVEARRSQKGGLEPDGPDCGEGAEPGGATHHIQTIGRVGLGPTLRTQTAGDRGHSAVCLGRLAPILGSKSGTDI